MDPALSVEYIIRLIHPISYLILESDVCVSLTVNVDRQIDRGIAHCVLDLGNDAIHTNLIDFLGFYQSKPNNVPVDLIVFWTLIIL